MQNVQDKFLIKVLNNKKYVINYYKVEKKLSDTEVSLFDESINLLLFNFMVSLDGAMILVIFSILQLLTKRLERGLLMLIKWHCMNDYLN